MKIEVYNITWATKQSVNGTGPSYLEKGYTVVKIANSNVKNRFRKCYQNI
jgi:hypothetical protein